VSRRSRGVRIIGTLRFGLRVDNPCGTGFFTTTPRITRYSNRPVTDARRRLIAPRPFDLPAGCAGRRSQREPRHRPGASMTHKSISQLLVFHGVRSFHSRLVDPAKEPRGWSK
jgi:hypothetical protein